jgi:hypothetical protein
VSDSREEGKAEPTVSDVALLFPYYTIGERDQLYSI